MIKISIQVMFFTQLANMNRSPLANCTTFLLAALFLSSCSIIEKASVHAFEDGNYRVSTDSFRNKKLYITVGEQEITASKIDQRDATDIKNIFHLKLNEPNQTKGKVSFKKSSIDIDISSVLMKYRPSVYGLPAQLTTDFNLAMYGGWRKDEYRIFYETSPAGIKKLKQNHRGFDVGLFAGAGNTLVSPFSTRSVVMDEYNGFVLQSGVAGFLETGFASFGIAGGFDHLTGPDGKNWIYQRKWWLGFMIGIALN